jgi:hypothetical protein
MAWQQRTKEGSESCRKKRHRNKKIKKKAYEWNGIRVIARDRESWKAVFKPLHLREEETKWIEKEHTG